MKKCMKCGAEMEDYSSFCPACGSAVEAPAMQVNPVVALVKRVGSSTPFLIALIAFGCEVLFSILSVVQSTLIMDSAISGVNFEWFFETNGVTATYPASIFSVMLSALVGSVLPILIFIGMLRFYLACRKSGPVVQCGGLAMTRVSYMVYYILMIIGLGLGLLALLILLGLSFVPDIQEALTQVLYYIENLYHLGSFGISGSELAAILSVIFIALFVFLVIYTVLAIIYGAQVLKSAKRVLNAARTGAYPEPLSRFVIVMNYIVAGLVALEGIFMLVTLNFALILCCAASCTALICISIAMQQYNMQVKALNV